MFAIPLVLMLGTGINVANTHPQNFAEVKAAVICQIKHPVIEPADYSKLNQ